MSKDLLDLDPFWAFMGNIAIFTDSLSTLQALNSADPDQMIQGLHSSLAKLTAQHSVSLQWMPAHVGLTGNERADILAKIGSQAPQTQNSATYREAKTLLHSLFNGDRKNENGGYQAHLDPVWRLGRAQQTTIFRLRTGHCSLRAHLKRIGISDTSLCECGQADQTLDHVLIYAERSDPVWLSTAEEEEEEEAFHQNETPFMYLCMHACIYVYTCVCACVLTYVSVHVCMHAYMYVCMHACLYACTYVCMYVYACIYVLIYSPFISVLVGVSVNSLFICRGFNVWAPGSKHLILVDRQSPGTESTAPQILSTFRSRSLSAPGQLNVCWTHT